MRSRLWSLAACITLAMGVAFVGGCGRSDATSVSAASEESTAAEQAANAASAAQVVIDNFAYSPAMLTVAVGAKVTWTNRDDVPHTVTSTSKPRSLDSPTLDTDESFAHVFSKPGTYEYYCAVHPKMTGRVIVK